MPATGKRAPLSDGTPARPDTYGQPEATDADICRCKQAKEKTPAQLLKTMLRDLAFWKKRDD